LRGIEGRGRVAGGKHGGELVAAQPAQHRAGREVLTQTPGEAADHLVADGVPAQVVDVLEIVDVEQQQGAAAAAQREHPVQPGGERTPPVQRLAGDLEPAVKKYGSARAPLAGSPGAAGSGHSGLVRRRTSNRPSHGRANGGNRRRRGGVWPS
jgi:hypothetical protein